MFFSTYQFSRRRRKRKGIFFRIPTKTKCSSYIVLNNVIASHNNNINNNNNSKNNSQFLLFLYLIRLTFACSDIFILLQVFEVLNRTFYFIFFSQSFLFGFIYSSVILYTRQKKFVQHTIAGYHWCQQKKTTSVINSVS